MPNKLVRDKIPEIIKNRGAVPVTHVAGGDEYGKKLLSKLQEEVDEFQKEPCEEEMADILEVIYAFCDLLDIDRDQLEQTRLKKAEERGCFADRIVLDDVKE